ncbi:RNA-binding S4 domain-containing protein [Uliginosibacterium sp. H1]|uniref:RNA-binding S4 domain-containing protein n=1 Tax=Uliginosibacterium sp. H1 TaxID=3114757 RepID=UPI002E18F343|nr:RNA-binding S4 domain-containing protein [Uliginosibacterium sp. H1]
MAQTLTAVRIDKWLWAARFFKTRTLATEAVEGGKIHVNGLRIKPAKDVKAGDRVEISIGETRWELVVQQLSDKRGPATVARTLYEETAESSARRAAQAEARRFEVEPADWMPEGRPTKRARRMLERLRRG